MLGVDDGLRLMIGLRDGLLLGRFQLGVDVRLRGDGIVLCGAERGAVGGTGRLRGIERVGIELRLLREGIVRWGVDREIDGGRLGALIRDDIGARLVRELDRIEDIERLGLELRMLREGVLRCGVGRETDREGDRVGADRVAWLLRLLLRELRRDDPAWAARASSRTAATAIARIARLELEVFFTACIVDLLSPAVSLSGDPELPFPHHRRDTTRHVRSCNR